MQQLIPRRAREWAGYLGREVRTADNELIGAVGAVLRHPQTGEVWLQVTESRDPLRPILVPMSAVGVVTANRLLLDATADRLSSIVVRSLDPALRRIG